MKSKKLISIFIFLLFIVSINAKKNADTSISKIQLTDTIQFKHTGVWENGDYTVFINLNIVKKAIELEYNYVKNWLDTVKKIDTSYFNSFTDFKGRCELVLKTINTSANEINLNNLVYYFGREKSTLNKNNSAEIERLVREEVAKGKAIILYKGKRISELKTLTIADLVRYLIIVYEDDNTNVLFKYYGYINW